MNTASRTTVGDILPLTGPQFDRIRQLVHRECGLDLRGGKESLVSARLQKKMRELGLRSFEEYYHHVLKDVSGQALTAMIDALTTNHTSFFREPAHFDFLRQTILPPLRRRDRIAVWSAACSTGEEPYSIAFCLLEQLKAAEFTKVRILATDISTRVLATAQRGAYPADRFDSIPAHERRQYLLRGEQRWKEWYLVKPELRAAVEFRRLNLMEPLSHLGPFPVIFCRNVMIYFDRPTQQDLVHRLAACLEPGGYLLVGHSESLNGIDHPLRYISPAIYVKPLGGDAARQRWSNRQ